MIAVADNLVWGLWLAVCLVNIALAGIFAGSETGIYRLNRVRLELQAEAGSRRARLIRRLLRDPDNLLAMLLTGTNIHQYIAAFAVSAMFVRAGYGHRSEWYALAVTTPVMFVFKDSLPKNIFQRLPERLTYALARTLRAADLTFKAIGLTYLVRGVSTGLLWLLGRKLVRPNLLGHEGLMAVVAEGHAVGTLTGSQRDMADRVMRISNVRVADVLQPMDKVVSAPAEVSRETFLQIVAQHEFSRIPLRDASGQVVGIVDVYDVLSDESPRPVSVYAAEATVIPASTSVTQALYALQRAKASLAIAADGDGRHVGLITIKDLVEEIVGELREW